VIRIQLFNFSYTSTSSSTSRVKKTQPHWRHTRMFFVWWYHRSYL